MAKRKKASKSLYQIKVTLTGSKPPIWRRLIVKDN
ncbi:MAG: plasmid pRiA4b ORF-3 family protein, partial [Deltaproteobacteria bacterium]|nr:plasmid pRiA4b ORF-3 family protein [Deltaproteobacteria bacterium]